jgi:hypothetical protein
MVGHSRPQEFRQTLGIQYQHIDGKLTADLDDFEEFRGSIAHGSNKTQQ